MFGWYDLSPVQKPHLHEVAFPMAECRLIMDGLPALMDGVSAWGRRSVALELTQAQARFGVCQTAVQLARLNLGSVDMRDRPTHG